MIGPIRRDFWHDPALERIHRETLAAGHIPPADLVIFAAERGSRARAQALFAGVPPELEWGHIAGTLETARATLRPSELRKLEASRAIGLTPVIKFHANGTVEIHADGPTIRPIAP